MLERNPGCELGKGIQFLLYMAFILIICIAFITDLSWVNKVNVNLSCVNEEAAAISSYAPLKGDYQAAWLLKAITCIDLTTLGGDDTESNVRRLCFKVIKKVTYLLIC